VVWAVHVVWWGMQGNGLQTGKCAFHVASSKVVGQQQQPSAGRVRS